MTTLRQILFGSTANSAAADAALLLLRVAFGLALALAHGVGKVPPSERFIGVTAEMGFPLPVVFAWAAGLAELAGGLLLVVGLLTRPAAVLAGVTMAVAAFVRHAGDAFADRELALLYLAVMVVLAITGAGRYSVDAALRRRLL